MAFKYKNMQKFVKQTFYPYVVNLTLLIKDAFKHIVDLENEVASLKGPIVIDLEKKIAENTAAIKANDNDIAALQQKDLELLNLINTNKAAIEANDADISALQTRMTAAESNINTITKTTIPSVQTSINNHVNNKSNPHGTQYMQLTDWAWGTNPPASAGLASNIKVYDQVLT